MVNSDKFNPSTSISNLVTNIIFMDLIYVILSNESSSYKFSLSVGLPTIYINIYV